MARTASDKCLDVHRVVDYISRTTLHFSMLYNSLLPWLICSHPLAQDDAQSGQARVQHWVRQILDDDLVSAMEPAATWLHAKTGLGGVADLQSNKKDTTKSHVHISSEPANL